MEGLSRAERRQTVGVLLKALCEDKPRLAWGAALALGDIGDPRSCKPLRDVVRSRLSSETRQAAVVAIRDLGDHKAVGVLARVLNDANEPSSLRGEAAEALGWCGFGSRRAVSVLIKALGDDSTEVRLFSANALGFIGDKRAIPALKSLLKDRAVVKPFGSVSKDALRSIMIIEERPWKYSLRPTPPARGARLRGGATGRK